MWSSKCIFIGKKILLIYLMFYKEVLRKMVSKIINLFFSGD